MNRSLIPLFRLLPAIAGLALLSIHTKAISEPCLLEQKNTYVGINFQYVWVKPKGPWEKIFPANHPGFNLYAGWRFLPFLAAELGADWTDYKPRSNWVPNQSTLLGLTNHHRLTEKITARVRFISTYLDLNLLLPLYNFGGCSCTGSCPMVCDCNCQNPLEFIISVGLSCMQPHIKVTADPGNQSNFVTQWTALKGKTQGIFRAGIGIQSIIVEDVGLRLLYRFENTASLRAKNNFLVNSTGNKKIFNNTQSLLIGVYLRF